MRKPTSKKLTCLALSLLMALGTAQTAVMAAGEDTAATTNTNTKTTLQEISESLDIPTGTVKTRLMYARRNLSQLLREDSEVEA